MNKYQHGLDTNNIRNLRHRSTLRQKDVADIMGFEVIDRISHWEKGRSQPSLINAIKLCKIYGVSLDQLYPNLCIQIEQEIQASKNTRFNNIEAHASFDIFRTL